MPLGREFGNLRGAAAAIRSLLSSQRPESQELEEIRSISSSLSTIRFSDIVPHDFEAEQHAKEHLGFDDPTTVKNTDSWAEETAAGKSKGRHRTERETCLTQRKAQSASPGLRYTSMSFHSASNICLIAAAARSDDVDTMRTYQLHETLWLCCHMVLHVFCPGTPRPNGRAIP